MKVKIITAHVVASDQRESETGLTQIIFSNLFANHHHISNLPPEVQVAYIKAATYMPKDVHKFIDQKHLPVFYD